MVRFTHGATGRARSVGFGCSRASAAGSSPDDLCGGRAVVETQLCQDTFHVLFGSPGTHVEDHSDLGVGLATSQPGPDLLLSRRETVVPSGRAGVAPR